MSKEKEILKVLLVEDNEDDVYLIKKSMDKQNIEINVLTNGKEAYDHIIRSVYDVILLDYKLPGLNGFEIMERLNSEIEEKAIVFLTADTLIETAVKAMKLGALDFYPKFKGYKNLYDLILKVHDRHKKIIERKTLKEALVTSEQKYRSIFENFQDIYIEIDSDRKIIEISPSVKQILCFDRRDLLGTLFSYLAYNKDRSELLFDQLDERNYVKNFEMKLKDQNDEPVICTLNLKLIEDGAKHCVGTISDISTYKKLEEMFYQSQKMDAVGKLSGSIAHDYNNFLQIILVSAQLSLLDSKLNEKTKEYLKNIISTTQSASNLTRSLLTLSRKHKYEPMKFDSVKKLRSMEGMIKAATKENVNVEIVTPETELNIMSDPIHFEQVLINLVVNSRDAMPEGGILKIELTKSINDPEYDNRNMVVLKVHDTGTGIKKDDLEKIFDPFFTTKAQGKGTGLGLSTVYNILQQNQATVKVNSKLGEFTEFVIMFNECDLSAKKVHTPSKVISGVKGKYSILVVEDQYEVRVSIGEMLLQAGYKVLYAPNLSVAEYTLKEYGDKIDIILSDIVLEDGVGFDLIKYVSEQNMRSQFVMMSGYGDDKLIKYADHKYYTDLILTKPFNLQQFTEFIQYTEENNV